MSATPEACVGCAPRRSGPIIVSPAEYEAIRRSGLLCAACEAKCDEHEANMERMRAELPTVDVEKLFDSASTAFQGVDRPRTR